MNFTSETRVGDVVKNNFKTAPLFQANNIDYCCGGAKTISEACAEAGVDSDHLLVQLEDIADQTDPDTQYINSLSLDELSDYIVKRHHTYVRSSIPFLRRSLDKLCEVHGENHPELFEIRTLFNESSGNLTMHMQKEEIMLFPYIRKLAGAKNGNAMVGKSAFGSISNPVKMMLEEHEAEGQRFDKIAGLSKNYSIPEDACTTYRVTLSQLKEFENDLHRHIHLENNILFPKAIELESELAANRN